MELTLERFDKNSTRTLGSLRIDGKWAAFTLENPVTPVKEQDHSAIPAGRYRINITFSERFQRPLPLLLDVPEFDGIRIHAGNTTADTHGCILVGLDRGANDVTRSRLALASVQYQIEKALDRGEEVWINVG